MVKLKGNQVVKQTINYIQFLENLIHRQHTTKSFLVWLSKVDELQRPSEVSVTDDDDVMTLLM